MYFLWTKLKDEVVVRLLHEKYFPKVLSQLFYDTRSPTVALDHITRVYAYLFIVRDRPIIII